MPYHADPRIRQSLSLIAVPHDIASSRFSSSRLCVNRCLLATPMPPKDSSSTPSVELRPQPLFAQVLQTLLSYSSLLSASAPHTDSTSPGRFKCSQPLIHVPHVLYRPDPTGSTPHYSTLVSTPIVLGNPHRLLLELQRSLSESAPHLRPIHFVGRPSFHRRPHPRINPSLLHLIPRVIR